MHIPHPLICSVAMGASMLLPGCVAPGYPYPYGYTPPGTVALPPQVPPGAVFPSGPVPVQSYTYAPPQIIVAPTFYPGCGWGYRYGNRYWPYRPNCGFWGGRYYNGYRWNGYQQGVHGAPYPYRGGYQGGYHGGYQGQGSWSR